jgi:hypothetical protein
MLGEAGRWDGEHATTSKRLGPASERFVANVSSDKLSTAFTEAPSQTIAARPLDNRTVMQRLQN